MLFRSVFSKFGVKENAKYEELKTVAEGGNSITITACLIQADGFTDANEAVNALPTEFLNPGAAAN